MIYLDFEITVLEKAGGGHTLIATCGDDQATGDFLLVLDEKDLTIHLKDIQNAMLVRSVQVRLLLNHAERTIQNLGKTLFNALFIPSVWNLYHSARRRASAERKQGIRLKLDIQSPLLAALPWEYLYHPTEQDYIGLSLDSPIIRILPVELAVPVTLPRPLRILGMVASPSDADRLDVGGEKQRLQAALAPLGNQVQLEWVPNGTLRALKVALDEGRWHIFHYIGHGGFDRHEDEGFLAFEDEQGKTKPAYATQLYRLFQRGRELQLAFLNSCDSARHSYNDLISAPAIALVRRGLPAVLAMQFAIPDNVAKTLTGDFYRALARGQTLEYALADARQSLTFEDKKALEWGVPVLYMRSIRTITEPVASLDFPDWLTGIEEEDTNIEPVDENTRFDFTEEDALHLIRFEIERKTSSITEEVISPDRKYLAAYTFHTFDRHILVWDIYNISEICCFAPYTYHYGGVKYLWGPEREESALFTYRRSPGGPVRFLFSPNGKYLAISGAVVYLWEVGVEQEAWQLRRGDWGASMDLRGIDFSPDSKYLVISGNGPALELWDVQTRQARWTVERNVCDTKAVKFSPNGEIIATVEGESYGEQTKTSVQLWDAANGYEIGRHELQENFRREVTLSFTNDNQTIHLQTRDSALQLSVRTNSIDNPIKACVWHKNRHNDPWDWVEANHLLPEKDASLRASAEKLYKLHYEYTLDGITKYESKHYDAAIQSLTNAIAMEGTYPLTYEFRGKCYIQFKETEKALADFNKAIEYGARGSSCYWERGKLCFDMGDYGQSMADFTTAIEREPEHADFHAWRGAAAYNSGNFSQAVQDFTKALRFGPEQPWYYHWRGLAYGKLGQGVQAESDQNKAIMMGYKS
jgi:tetratricopeptide (TPR) repeat protein